MELTDVGKAQSVPDTHKVLSQWHLLVFIINTCRAWTLVGKPHFHWL